MPADKPPFEELYRDYLSRIYAFLRAQLGSAADAEDVAAQVFMKAYEAYGRFEPRFASPAAWLFQIARNAAMDHHRRRGRRERLEQVLARQPEAEVDPGRMAEERLRHRELLEAVASLPERQRQVVALRHGGLTFLEVGGLMGCSEDAAKMLHHRALRALRALLPEAAP